MIPWIVDREIASSESDAFVLGYGGSSLVNLTHLIAEIEGSSKQKDRIALIYGPRTIVWNPYGDAEYLFRFGRKINFASFATDGTAISSVALRYNDPLDPNSGRRADRQIMTGWQGVVELIAAAVQRSKAWKNLETIETHTYTERWDSGETAHFTLWATPRHTWRVAWDAQHEVARRFRAGAHTFVHNQPVQIAEISVHRYWEDEYFVEKVTEIRLFPEQAGSPTGNLGRLYVNSTWEEADPSDSQVVQNMHELPMPLCIDLGDQFLMRIKPHDDLMIDMNWE